MPLRSALVLLTLAGFACGVGLMVAGHSSRPQARAASATGSAAMMAVPAGSATLERADFAVPGFSIDPREVSVAEYHACVRAGACKLHVSATGPGADLWHRHEASSHCRGGRGDRATEPMNCVDWFGADAYCRWAGKRLPTREEWWLAIGSKHPDHAEELHHPASDGAELTSEWTASTVKSSRTEWPAMRWVGEWHYDGYEPWRWRSRPTIKRDMTRWSSLGFRCAR